MTIRPVGVYPNDPLDYTGIKVPVVPVVGANRDPNDNDNKYTLMTEWLNEATQTWFKLVGFNTGLPVWVTVESAVGGILPVNEGGTGDATLTLHGVLIGEGTNPVNVTAAGTDGQVLTANTGADPAFANIGTKSGLTAHGVLIAEGAGAFAATSAGTAGQILVSGGPSADPTWTSGFTTGTVQTTDATPTDLITFDCGATAGVYTFSVEVSGYASVGAGTPLGVGYTLVGTIRTDGAAATFIDQQVDAFEEGAMSACAGTLTTSGNNAVVQVTGVAAYTINWSARLINVFAHA